MNTELFPLSEKYIDFLKYDCSCEFLEGTTFAGKTTVGIPKFMFKIMNNTTSKPSIIAGLDLGTIEKNIINSDNGLIEVFGDYEQGGCIEYNPNGKDKVRMPHIRFHTPNGIKIIYTLGYDNVKRWKKALGGQCFGLFIDEFNIADMDFVREAFMRADYRLCTLNPDDPNKECYTQYVNHARPIEKYKNDAPSELLEQLNLEQTSDWTWWYFTFNHNLSLSEEKKQQIIESVPKGTKLYKNKIKGLRGKATGLVFNLEKKNIISRQEALTYKYIRYAIGVDTSYSKRTHDKLTFTLIGITDNKKCVILEEGTYNNKNREVPFAPSDVVPMIIKFAEKSKILWKVNKLTYIFIDSADSGTISEAQKFKRLSRCIYQFVPAWKKTPNLIRVQLQQSWMNTCDFLIVEECKNYIEECNTYSFTEDGDLEDGNDHSIQGGQYGWLPFKKMIGNWEIIKQFIKDNTSEETLEYDIKRGK